MSAPAAPSDLGTLPARDLVRLVQAAVLDDNDPEAQSVLAAFYHRYAGYVARVVANHTFEPPGDPTIDDRVHDTFIGFFDSCAQFDLMRGTTDEAFEATLLAYLAHGAVWLCRNAHRTATRSNRVQVLPDDDLLRLQENAPAIRNAEPDPADHAPPDRLAIAEAWVRSLSERDADIIRSYFYDDHAGPYSDRLPPREIARLAEKYGLTAAAIRKAKARLLDKFLAFFNSVTTPA